MSASLTIDIDVPIRINYFLEKLRNISKQIKKEENKKKVVAFNGSPRKDSNTAILINYLFHELEKEEIETELVQLS